MQGLPVSRLIDVSVNLSPIAAQFANFNSLLILGSSTVIDVIERMRSYDTLDGVANDFGTSAPEYLAADLWFSQSPKPTNIKIGRWAASATHGKLIGSTLSAAQQALSNFTAVTSGGFSITVDGVVQHVAGVNLSGVANLNGVASAINSVLTGATVAWNATYSRFEVTDTSTGATSVLSFASAPTTGTDISGLLGLTMTSSGAYLAAGMAQETALAAVELFDTNFSSQWYAVTVTGAVDSDHTAIAAYIEGASTPHIYGISTQESGILVSGDTSDIAYTLAQAKYQRTVVQYSSSSAYSVCSLLARILTTDWNANNSTITLMYKQEPGITAENLNTNQMAALEAKNCNVFVNYNNGTAIIEPGVVSSGDFVDTIIGVDWLANRIQTDVYNLLYTSSTKIPQTDAGNHLLATTMEASCAAAVNNGLLGPGTWTSGGFGQLKQNDPLPKGYYVYCPPISTQSAADRQARKSVALQIAAKLAGAVHDVDVTLNVNR